MIRGPFVVTEYDLPPIENPRDEQRTAVCMDCNKPLNIGALYVERLEGLTGNVPVCDIVCVECGEAV